MNIIIHVCMLFVLMYVKMNVCEYHVYVFGGYRLMLYDAAISVFGIKTCAEALVEYVKFCLKCLMAWNVFTLGNKFRCILNSSRTMYLCN